MSKKTISFDYLTTTMMEVDIPVTKKHRIILNIRDKWAAGNVGIYPPTIRIMCGHKDVTEYYIQMNANDNIEPTCENLKTAIDLIDEAEYRMTSRKEIDDAEKGKA